MGTELVPVGVGLVVGLPDPLGFQQPVERIEDRGAKALGLGEELVHGPPGGRESCPSGSSSG